MTRPSSSTVVVALHGEHDLTARAQLARLLADEVGANDLVVVDVTDADFVDSSVLHNLFRADNLASARGSRFVLQMGTAHIVRSAIKNSGLLDVVECADSRDEALSLAPVLAAAPTMKAA